MMRLRLSVAPFPGEPINSILGRIAARNGASFVQDFCADMNISWRAVSVGEAAALADMAKLTGISTEVLRRDTARVRGHLAYDVNGHHLTRKTLDRSTLKVCPQCLLGDLKEEGALGRHCRVEWTLRSYQVCHIHRSPMLILPDAEYPRCPHDFYQRIRDHWPCIRRSSKTADRINADLAWETYLAKRIRGSTTNAWCDKFDFDLTCQMAVNLGTVLHFGASRNPSDLKPGEIPIAAGCAFKAMQSGPSSLLQVLHKVREASGSPRPGFQADFGAFSRWLYRIDYESVRFSELLDIVTKFAFATYPYGAGDVLFGRTCHKRQIHNIASAAKQHRMKYPRMTNLVRSLGLAQKGSYERIEFSAEKFDPVLGEFAKCLRPKHAAKKLGFKLDILQQLESAGLLNPRFRFPSMLPVYHPDDLDEFTLSITRYSEVVQRIPNDRISLLRLPMHAKCQFEEIVQAAQSGSLGSLCRMPTSTKACDCYANLEDLRDHIQKKTHRGYTKQDAKRFLRVNGPTVALLIERLMLKAKKVRHHRSRRPMALITKNSFLEFLEHYVTLGMMAHAAGTQAVHVATKLEKAGIHPLTLGAKFSKIYERTPEIESHFNPGEIDFENNSPGEAR